MPPPIEATPPNPAEPSTGQTQPTQAAVAPSQLVEGVSQAVEDVNKPVAGTDQSVTGATTPVAEAHQPIPGAGEPVPGTTVPEAILPVKEAYTDEEQKKLAARSFQKAIDIVSALPQDHPLFSKYPGLKEAVEITKKVKVVRSKAAEKVKQAQAAGEAAKTITDTYYDEKRGIYHELDDNGNPTEVEIKLSHAVKPLIDALQSLAEEKDSTAQKPTKQAEEAIEILDFLKPETSLKQDPTDSKGYYLDYKEIFLTPEQRAEREAVGLVVDLIDTVTGIDLRQVINSDGTIDEEKIKQLPANTTLGALGVLCVKYQKLANALNTDARRNLAALIFKLGHQEAFRLNSAKPAQYSELLTGFNSFSQDKNNKILEDQIKALSDEFHYNWMKNLGVEAAFTEEEKVQILVLGHACAGKIKDKVEGQAVTRQLPQDAEDLLTALGASPAVRNAIIASVSKGNYADLFLKSKLGIDLSEIDKLGDIPYVYAPEVVKLINHRRQQLNKEQLDNQEMNNYAEVITHHMEGVFQNIKGKGLMDKLKSLGGTGLMFLVVLAPAFQQFLSQGTFSDDQQQGREGH